METYNKITQVLKSEKAQELISFLQDPGNKMISKLKAKNQLKELVESEISKYYSLNEYFEIPNIRGGSGVMKSYSVKVCDIANHILKDIEVSLRNN